MKKRVHQKFLQLTELSPVVSFSNEKEKATKWRRRILSTENCIVAESKMGRKEYCTMSVKWDER